MVLWPWLLILMLIISLVLVLQYANRNLAMANQCREQMKRIYGALGFYEVQNGSLPTMSFYPENPLSDEDSLRVVLEAYGLDPETVSPDDAAQFLLCRPERVRQFVIDGLHCWLGSIRCFL